jgi:hypothetical protein
MLAPGISTRIKQTGQSSRIGISAGDIWALGLIAPTTRESQILQFRFAAMLTRNDVIQHVLKLKSQLRDQAIFTTIGGDATDSLL